MRPAALMLLLGLVLLSAVTAESLTSCLKERQLAGKKPLIGAYVPQCDGNGNYRPMQCHESTGMCWCVSTNGKEIAGTRNSPGQSPPTCGATESLTSCLKERQLAGKKPLIGAYVPQCDGNGNYRPMQCHESTGMCWCVSTNGKEIAGTRNSPGQSPPTCGATESLTSCLKERQLAGKKPLIGAYVPQCDGNGNYRPMQCHESTGMCWCVNTNGKEIAGTRNSPGQSPPTCGATESLTSCLKERQLAGKKPLIGAYVPQCDGNGNYRPKQCHESTGVCWCVSTNGKEIAGTRNSPGQSPPTCGATESLTSCLKERQLAGKKPLIGAYVPQCDGNGNYSPMQCHESTGMCWCVNTNGKEIAGTRNSPGQSPPTCGATA
ncbi:thyroglobulin-like [Mixophyes fleayi]|uniref:thyroglobulin-like n=1 Tax=Mixophyes fleayi TaxID=3061075 RepID=UPI003F4DD580